MKSSDNLARIELLIWRAVAMIIASIVFAVAIVMAIFVDIVSAC